MYYNDIKKDMQEIIEVQPHHVKPVLHFDSNLLTKMCEQGILQDQKVLDRLVTYILQESTSASE